MEEDQPLTSFDREIKTWVRAKGSFPVWPPNPFLTSSKWTKNYHTWVVVPPLACLPVGPKPEWNQFEWSQKAVPCHCMIMSWARLRDYLQRLLAVVNFPPRWVGTFSIATPVPNFFAMATSETLRQFQIHTWCWNISMAILIPAAGGLEELFPLS